MNQWYRVASHATENRRSNIREPNVTKRSASGREKHANTAKQVGGKRSRHLEDDDELGAVGAIYNYDTTPIVIA